MGKRKVAQIGPSTLMVSLPSKWVKQYGVCKGDEFEVVVAGRRLILETPTLKTGKTIRLELDGLNANLVRHLIYAAYRSGSNDIELLFNKKTVFDHNINKNVMLLDVIDAVVDRLVGVEILKQKKDYCLIKEISSVNVEEFDQALKRIFITLISTSQDLCEAAKQHDEKTLESIQNNADKKINKLSDFCLRIINKGGIVATEKIPQYYAITSLLEQIGDIVIGITKTLHEQKLYSHHKIITTLSDLLHELYHLFCDYKKDHLTKLYDLRQQLADTKVRALHIHLAQLSALISTLTSEIVSLNLTTPQKNV